MDPISALLGKKSSVSGSGVLRASKLRQQRKRNIWVLSLNLTPMIDIVFLLLCYFLMMSQFRTPEGVLPARLPAVQAQAAVEIPRTPIRVRFHEDKGGAGRCMVTIDQFDDSPMEISQLASRLQYIRQHVPGFDAETPVHLLAADDIAWDHVVNAYNAALAAEYVKIYFAGLDQH